ncbi:MAG: hypothetical protein HQL82_14720 [Magnetococcales bacterium]|nr:hypothetical protein [Magnetococcales bacterium]
MKSIIAQARGRSLQTRRTFLKWVLGVAASGAMAKVVPEEAQVLMGQYTQALAAVDDGRLDPKLDFWTATLVGGTFGWTVFWEAAFKGKEFSIWSALKVNTAYATRIALLQARGGRAGRLLAAREEEEWLHGMIPIPLLALLSTWTTAPEDLKVNLDRLFPPDPEALEPNFDYKRVAPLPTSNSLEDWEDRLRVTRRDVAAYAARVASVGLTLAPLGTTYLSSSLTNQMKRRMLRILYEKNLAGIIVSIKRANRHGCLPEACMVASTAAMEKAEAEFNGVGGFSKLMVALSANLNGQCGIGDPPEIYLFAKYFRQHPDIVAASHASGIALSGFHTILFNVLWLEAVAGGDARRTGPLPTIDRATAGRGRRFIAMLAANVETVAKGFARSVFDSRTYRESEEIVASMDLILERARTRNRAKDAPHKRDVLPVLDDVLQLIEGMPHVVFHFDPRNSLRKRERFFKQLLDDDLLMGQVYSSIDPEALKSSQAFAESGIAEDIRRSVVKGDFRLLGTLLAATRKQAENYMTAEIADVFARMLAPPMDAEVADRARPRPAGGSSRSSPLHRYFESLNRERRRIEDRKPELIEKMERDIDLAMRFIASLLDRNLAEDAVRSVMTLLGIQVDRSDPELVQGLREKVLAADDNTLAKVVRHFNGTHRRRGEYKAQFDPEHETGVFSPEGREVLIALLTQIPAVPALSRLAKLTFEHLYGTSPERPPTAAQLKEIISSTLILCAVMSGTADNVAAFLFASEVMLDSLKQRYGEELMQRHGRLATWVIIAAIKVAEASGALTRVGNGPNMSQKKMFLEIDPGYSEGIRVEEKEEKQDMLSSMANGWAYLQVFLTIAGFVTLISAELDRVQEDAGSAA